MMGSMSNLSAQIVMDMEKWRGYSAYEIAVQHGFEGSETEWLASLKGEPGDDAATITVNRKDAVDKNIMLYGTDIYVQSGTTRTIADALENVVTSDVVVDSLDSDDPTKPLSAAAGKKLALAIGGMVHMDTFQVTLTQGGWGNDNTQTVGVDELKSGAALLVVGAPETFKAYTDAGVFNSAQGENTLTFTCEYQPSSDLKANVLMLWVEEVATVV